MNSMYDNRFDVIARLQFLLAERGWTRYRLAKESGIPHSTLTNLWRRANTPTIATLEDICHALGITMAEFFTLPGNDAPALSAEQRTLLARWSRLTAEQRASFLQLMQCCACSSSLRAE